MGYHQSAVQVVVGPVRVVNANWSQGKYIPCAENALTFYPHVGCVWPVESVDPAVGM